MGQLKRACASLRAGFEEQFREAGSASLFVGLACNLAFVGQVYFWPALWHTSALMVSYTDATYVAELLCAVALVLRARRGGSLLPSGRALWILAALVQATLVAYCVAFEMGVEVPDPVNWAFGAVFGVYLPVAMVSWIVVHAGMRSSAVVWNIMLAAVFAAFAIWVFSGLVGVKICACMAVLLFIGTFVLARKLRAVREAADAPRPSEDARFFQYPVSATFLFSFAFITATSFAGIEGASASFAAGAFFAPMLLLCALGLLVNVSAFPLTSIAVPAIVMATISASSLNLDPALSFDLAALGMFLFLAYAVVLLCAGMRGDRRGAAFGLLNLMVAFTGGCIVGRAFMAACFLFAPSFASDIMVILSVLAASAAMFGLIRRGLMTRRAGADLDDGGSADAEALRAAARRAQLDRIAAEHNLGEREKEVLVLLLEGKSASEVARAMVVANGTVKSHIRHVYKKLGVHSRDELFEMFGADRDEGASPPAGSTSPGPGRR